MKTAMNYLMLNLAVADMMVGAFFAPAILFMSTFTHPTGTAGDILCKLVTGKNIAWVASLVSAFSLVLVAVERFYAVVHPLNTRRKITKRKLKVLVPVCWILAIGLTSPSFLADKYKEDSKACSERLPRRWQNVLYNTVWTINSAIVPEGVISGLYARVIHTLWFKKNSSDASRLAVIKARKRITKMMITISTIYIFCCFPTHIVYFLYIFYPDWFPSGDSFFTISYCLLVFNSSINPFIYALQSRKFRAHLKGLMKL